MRALATLIGTLSDLRKRLVGRTGFEPVTSSVSECRSGRLGSAIEALTCGLASRDPNDSSAFPSVPPRVLGPM